MPVDGGGTVSFWAPVSFQLDHANTAITTHTNRPKGVAPAQFVTGVRYGFGQSCCAYFDRAEMACPVNSCPIRLYNSTLPAVPFIAAVTPAGVCKCEPPMVCDG